LKSLICKKKIIKLKNNKVGHLSDKATQFWVDKSEIVRPIFELPANIDRPSILINSTQKIWD